MDLKEEVTINFQKYKAVRPLLEEFLHQVIHDTNRGEGKVRVRGPPHSRSWGVQPVIPKNEKEVMHIAGDQLAANVRVTPGDKGVTILLQTFEPDVLSTLSRMLYQVSSGACAL